MLASRSLSPGHLHLHQPTLPARLALLTLVGATSVVQRRGGAAAPSHETLTKSLLLPTLDETPGKAAIHPQEG